SMRGTGLDLRPLGNIIRAIESLMSQQHYVREEPDDIARENARLKTVQPEPGADSDGPIVLRESGRLFRRWLLVNAIFVPVALLIGYGFSRGGLAGTAVAVLFFGFILFFTLVVAAFFPTIIIDPRTRRVEVVRELFGLVPIKRKEKGFAEFELIRVYDYQ